MNKIRSYLPWGATKNVVRIVRLQGTLRAQTRGQSLNLQKIEKHLIQAFDTKKVKPKAVCLEINSMGGAVVQSNLIYHRIRNLSKATGVPVLSFAEDFAASGGYWIALAGDEIVDPNSMVGSIGVLSGTFGMEETIGKLGLEWRIFTAGENKFRMDPFRQLKPEDVHFTTKKLQEIHNNFINLVKQRRKKVDVNHKTVFTGDIFTGQEAISMGLADGICSDVKTFCFQRYGDVKFERCEPPKGLLGHFQGLGTSARIELSVRDLLDELSDQQQQAKFGF